MVIDEIKYKLPSDNYLQIENTKTQIVIGHTNNNEMKHYNGWLHRHNGKYQKTAAFTIDAAGSIYKHFEPKLQSKFFGNQELDDKSIVILLDNDGWLIKDNTKNQYITWNGHIYKEPTKIVEKRWRGYNYWSPYTKEQMESAKDLVKLLCEQFEIPMTSIIHNTKVENFNGYEGVIYKSNLERHFTDLSPAWDFQEFKNKIETN